MSDKNPVMHHMRVLYEIYAAVGLNDDDVDAIDLFDRLADLIEPGEPKVRCVAECKVDGERIEQLVHDAAVELTVIDRDALLALADSLEQHAYEVLAGTNFVSSDDMCEYARRIREALGIKDEEPDLG